VGVVSARPMAKIIMRIIATDTNKRRQCITGR
jgi:hypothetical protein